MSAHSFAINLDRALRNGFFKILDPGSAGTFGWSNKGKVIVPIVTAGAEGRVLPPAANYGIGTELLAYGQVLGGAASITGTGTTVVLNTAGDAALFVVVESANGTHVWRCAMQTATGNIVPANVVTEATAASAADQIVTSAGASKVVKDSGIAIGNIATRAANAASAGLIPQSGGADKSLAAITPVALGTFTVSTNNDATTNAKLVLVINKLVALGLFTGTAS